MKWREKRFGDQVAPRTTINIHPYKVYKYDAYNHSESSAEANENFTWKQNSQKKSKAKRNISRGKIAMSIYSLKNLRFFSLVIGALSLEFIAFVTYATCIHQFNTLKLKRNHKTNSYFDVYAHNIKVFATNFFLVLVLVRPGPWLRIIVCLTKVHLCPAFVWQIKIYWDSKFQSLHQPQSKPNQKSEISTHKG